MLRELLAAAIEHGHLDEPVYVWARTLDGEYVRHQVTDFTSDQRTGKPRQELIIEPAPEDL